MEPRMASVLCVRCRRTDRDAFLAKAHLAVARGRPVHSAISDDVPRGRVALLTLLTHLDVAGLAVVWAVMLATLRRGAVVTSCTYSSCSCSGMRSDGALA